MEESQRWHAVEEGIKARVLGNPGVGETACYAMSRWVENLIVQKRGDCY